jgi:hypothetical protein
MIKKKIVTNKKKLTVNSITSRKPRRATFSPEDEAFINENPELELDKMIGFGNYGAVYSIKDHDLAVKVPHNWNKGRCEGRFCGKKVEGGCIGKRYVDGEGSRYERYNMEHEELLVPTKRVVLGKCDAIDGNCIGIVRPKLNIITDPKYVYSDLTNSQIEQVRRKLISLSHNGFELVDGLQIGIDNSGRILQFDLGDIEQVTVSKAFRSNARDWISFLSRMKNINSKDRSGRERLLQKHGTINPNERY